MLKLIPLAVFMVIVGFLAKGLTLDPATLPSALLDKPAPEFSLPVLGDSQKTISGSDLGGSPYLLNVFASWCASCVVEHPLLVNLGIDEPSLMLVGLNYKDEPQAATQWLNRFGNPFKLVLDDREGLIGIDWGVVAVPETFVVDGSGIVRFKHTGPLNEKLIDGTIRPLIKTLSGQS